MLAKVTQRTELGPLRALPTVRQARIERGTGLSLAQCAQRTLTPDVAWDRDFGSGRASRVAMMEPADHREGDDFPSIDGLALAGFGGVLVEPEVGPRSVIVLEVLPQDAPQVWFWRNARQECDGGFRRSGVYRDTVASATSKPSFSSSP
jgi:hypothetical protein